MSHGHSHGCGGHDHDHDSPDRGALFSLYTKIDTERVECLNEASEGSGKLVFKPWDERLDFSKVGAENLCVSPCIIFCVCKSS